MREIKDSKDSVTGKSPFNQAISSSLRLKVVALVLVLCLFPLGLVIFLNYRATSRSLIETAERQLGAAAGEVASAIDTFLTRKVDSVGLEAKVPAVASFLQAHNQKDRVEALYNFERMERYHAPYLLSVALLSAQGDVVLEDHDFLKGNNESSFDHYSRPEQSGLPFVSPVHFEARSGEPYFAVSAPVLDPKGGFVGVLRAIYDARVFQRLTAAKSGLLGPKTHGVLLNENQMILGYGAPAAESGQFLFNLGSALAPGRTEALQARGELPANVRIISDPEIDEAIEGSNLTQGETSSASVMLQSMPWRVAFLMPVHSILGPLQTQAIQAALLLAGITSLVVLFALWTARVLFDPMRNLTLMARHVAEGDLNVKMPVESRDEVGILAETFNKMARQLREREEERSLLLSREQKARAEAERANRLKDEFLTTLSHELRTPLAAILGWINLLKSVPASSDLEEGLRMIERNAWAETQLVDDLLDLSRIACGKIELNRDALDFNAILDESIETASPAAQAKKIRVTLKIGDPDACILGDWNRLRQVFLNLLVNAIKFTPEGGEITVQQERREEKIVVSIHDTGIGINRHDLKAIFHRFMQVDSSSTRKFGGMGLGLPISKHLVELHGGSIHAESEGEGRGATFVVELPVLITMDR